MLRTIKEIVDYPQAYPQCKPDVLAEVSYSRLKSGSISIKGKKVPAASLSSYARAVEIAAILKERIQNGKFLLSEPVAPLPGVGSDYDFKPLKERPILH